MEASSFAERLGVLITDRLKMAGTEFAEEIGISQKILLDALSGRSALPPEIVCGMFMVYPDHLYWLLSGTEGSNFKSNLSLTAMDQLLPVLRDRSLSPDIRKAKLSCFLQCHFVQNPGLPAAEHALDQIQAVFSMFGLELEDEDVARITPPSATIAHAA